MNPTVLNPNKKVTLRDGEIVVSEMPWPAAMEFLAQLSAHAEQILKPGDTKGTLVVDQTAIPKLVIGAGALSKHLILNSTGKEEAWLKTLSFREGLLILKTALELNLSPEIVDVGKEMAGHLAGALGLKVPTLRKSPTS